MNSLSTFRRTIWQWYHTHGRHDLPWRTTKSPYRILVSECMLQQTQVGRVLPKYQAFVKALPTIKALASASQASVLRLWQGLGYNRRALNLQRLARVVMEKYNGKLPRTIEELEALPGVGPYTARAIVVLAFNLPAAMVETNIRKVILHYFFPKHRKVDEREIVKMAERILDKARPRDWNLALMDYGAGKFSGAIKNPNRRSAGYTRQSRFTDSRRFVRGRVVAWLTSEGSLTMNILKNRLKEAGVSKERLSDLPSIIEELEREGFLVEHRNKLKLL